MLPLHSKQASVTTVTTVTTTNSFSGMDMHFRVGINRAKMSAMMHAVGHAGKHMVHAAIVDAASVGVGMEMGAVLAAHMAHDGMKHMLHGLHHAEAAVMHAAMGALETSASAILVGMHLAGEMTLGTIELAMEGADRAGTATMNTFMMVAVGGAIMLRNMTVKMEDMMLVTLPEFLLYAKSELSDMVTVDVGMDSVTISQVNLQLAVQQTNFSRMTLTGLNLSGMNLANVSFRHAVLTDLNLLGATIDASTKFRGAQITLALPDWSIKGNLSLHLPSLVTTINNIHNKATRVALMAQVLGSLTMAHLAEAEESMMISLHSVITSSKSYLKDPAISAFAQLHLGVDIGVDMGFRHGATVVVEAQPPSIM